MLLGTKAVKIISGKDKGKKTKKDFPVVVVTAAALLLKMNWSYVGPEKVRWSGPLAGKQVKLGLLS